MLLTCCPAPGLSVGPRGGAAAWAYPVVGFAVGGTAALAGLAALAVGLAPALAAGLALAVAIFATGALHEDGLADCADALWSGRGPSERLAIMRDSRIGAYGATALILAIGLRWAALAELIAEPGWPAILLSAAALSRVAVAMVQMGPSARPDGLAASQGRVPPAAAAFGLALGLGGTVLLTGALFIPLIITLGVAFLLHRILRARIGGQSGDGLGATQQVSEVGLLLSFAAA